MRIRQEKVHFLESTAVYQEARDGQLPAQAGPLGLRGGAAAYLANYGGRPLAPSGWNLCSQEGCSSPTRIQQ